MRFINFINESTDISEVANLIKKDCKPFLKVWKNLDLLPLIDSFIYSGRKGQSEVFIKKKVRKDRNPLNSGQYIHEILDELFFERFEIKARSQSLFVTSKYSEASNYGTPYVIFPIGKFNTIWSSLISDLYMHMGIFSHTERKELTREDFKNQIDERLISKYKKGNLTGAIKSGNEIMLICDEYYGIKCSRSEKETILLQLSQGIR
jgi:hypothetical protein